MPIGFRDANAIVRQAELNQKRVATQLYNAEYKLQEVIFQRYRDAESFYLQIETSRSARRSAEQQIEADQRLLTAGVPGVNSDPASFTLNLLTAQSNLAISTAQEYQNIALYNIALAQIEYEKGTIQRYNNVSVAEGSLPAHVNKKAADHFAAREAAIPLREKPDAGSVALPMTSLPDLATPLPTLPPPPMSTGTGAVATPTRCRMPALAPSSRDANPEPRPLAPMAPPPMPVTPTGPVVQGRPQLQPADAPGTFEATGTVVLPTRIQRGPATPDVPISVPR